MAESCQEQVVEEQTPLPRLDVEGEEEKDLLQLFYDFLIQINSGRNRDVKERDNGSDTDDDVSSEDSADDELEQQRHQESVQDIQQEIARLEISEEASTLETLILIVEHYIKTGDTDGFRKNMRRPDMWRMTSPRPRINDVIAMADAFVLNKLPFRAVLMYKCASALYKYEYVKEQYDVTSNNVTPDDAIRGIEECMWKVLVVFQSIFNIEDMAIYLPHFVPVLYDMITNLREIRHSDRKLKSELESWGLLYIAFVHGRLNETVEMDDVAETAIKLLEKRFKKKVSRNQVHGLCLFMESLAKYYSGDFKSSKESGEKAVVSMQNADGFPSWDEKVKLVEKAKILQQEIISKMK